MYYSLIHSVAIVLFSFEGQAAQALYSSEFCLGLFNIACFFTEVPHNLVQTKSYILKYGVSLSRLDHATSLAGDT